MRKVRYLRRVAVRRVKRRVLLILSLIAGGLLFFLVAMPVWFPWVLRPLARSQGFGYAHYTRAGYSGFLVSTLTLTNGSTIVRAGRVEGLLPLGWVWRLAFAKQPPPFLRVWDWEYMSGPTPPGQATSQEPLYADVQRLAKTFRTLGRWVPAATLSNGTIRVENSVLAVSSAVWSNGNLNATIAATRPAFTGEVRAHIGDGFPLGLELRSKPLHLQANVTVRTNGPGLELLSTAWWWSNRVELESRIGPKGTLPQSARLTAVDFRIPADVMDLKGYQELAGSLSANWSSGQFSLEAGARAQPLPGQTNLPPLALNLHVHGDTNQVAIERATLTSPALQASLSQSVLLSFTGPLLREPAHLRLAADLARQPWLPITGHLDGDADFTPGGGKYPVAQFRVSGVDVAGASLKASRVDVEGRLTWPQLEIRRAHAQFEDQTRADLSGNVNLEDQSFAAGHFDFQGPLARRWLPPGYGYRDLTVSGTFAGSLTNLQHQGRLEAAGFTNPNLRPLNLRAEWSGQSTNQAGFELLLAATNSSMQVKGAISNQADRIELRLAELSLKTNNQAALDLAAPCSFTLSHSAAQRAWRLEISPLDWQGPAGQIHAQADVAWPARGNVKVAISRFSSSLLGSFSTNGWPELSIEHLGASMAWTNGPAEFALDLTGYEPHGIAPAAPALALSAALHLEGGPNGITISNLIVNSQTSTVAVAHGFLPVTVNPASPTNLLQFDLERPLQFTAQARPHAFFWSQLAAITGLHLRQPQLQATVTGTWRKPRGQIHLAARQIELRTALKPAPRFENLQVTLELDRQQARLAQGQFLVQGQLVTVTGQVPLGEKFWQELGHHRVPSWEQASGELRIAGAEVAAFEPLIPSLLAPQGELDADLIFSPGANFTGQVTLRNGRTRPLGTTGPLRNIELKLLLRDRLIALADASARIGGSIVSLTGHVDLRGTNWLAGVLPPFELSLHGTNVPLSREPESIIRSDLLLGVTHTNGAPPLVNGVAHLRDSYYLSDLRDLIPGKVAAPGRRPPYFSIEDPLLAGWRLAVQVNGERFLKIRSSIFNGEITANLKLEGTLKDPIALGDLKIDSGTVRFPFASLQVQQGLVVLTSQDPYRPQITLTATSKQFGYDLHMDVSGPVDGPVLQFNSSPPLSSDQILLMVTAGELPQGSFSLTPQQKAQTVAMFLGRDLLAKLGLGDQTQQRLTIRSGEEISEQGRPTYHIEYKLTDRWSIAGEYDRFGDFNADLIWRVYSK